MKRSAQILVGAVALTVFLAACSNVLVEDVAPDYSATFDARRAEGGAAPAPAPTNTIVDIASSSDDFEILTQAVIFAGLADELSGRRQYTVFAPTDDAFVDLLGALGLTAEELLAPGNEELVRSILLYHVAPGERFAADVTTSDRVNTLLKEFAFVQVTADGAFIGNDTYGFAQIVGVDIDASNGVIHVLNKVLLQPSLEL